MRESADDGQADVRQADPDELQTEPEELLAAADERQAEATELEAEAAELRAEITERQAEPAERKAQVMQRLAALAGPYKEAVADSGPDAERLKMLFGTVKSCVGKKHYIEAIEGLDLLESLMADSAESPAVAEDHDRPIDDAGANKGARDIIIEGCKPAVENCDKPAHRIGTEVDTHGIIIEGCMPSVKRHEKPVHRRQTSVDLGHQKFHREPPGRHAKPAVRHCPPEDYVGSTTCAELPPDYVGPTCSERPPDGPTAADQPVPGPVPEGLPDGTPEPEFKAPPSTRQPTLRQGDKSPDGWVEYLQQLLGVPVTDGLFDDRTYKAVWDFQTDAKKSDPTFMVDGIVGNQTWAALRGTAAERPGTDKRPAHTFVDKGPQARWYKAHGPGVYRRSKDLVELTLVSIGDTPMTSGTVRVRVTAPGDPPTVTVDDFPIDVPPHQRTPDDQGDLHLVRLKFFRRTFPSTETPPPSIMRYKIEAYVLGLGDDSWSGRLKER